MSAMQWEKTVQFATFQSLALNQRRELWVCVCVEELSSSYTLEQRRGRGRWAGCLPGPWFKGPTNKIYMRVVHLKPAVMHYTSTYYYFHVYSSCSLLLFVLSPSIPLWAAAGKHGVQTFQTKGGPTPYIASTRLRPWLELWFPCTG